jgi:hypothetical protein
MTNNCYNFYVDDEATAFIDIIVWTVQKNSEYNLTQAIDLVNRFHQHYPRIWGSRWYQHEGFSQLICGMFCEELGQGEYRDLNFPKFRKQFIQEHINLFSLLDDIYGVIVDELESYPADEDIKVRIDFIDRIRRRM